MSEPGWISNNKTECRKEAVCLAAWCKDNNLSINFKIKELVIDFRKQSGGHVPICINGAEVEMVESIKFLGVMINNLSWSTNVDAMVQKAQQHLYFLRRLRKSGCKYARQAFGFGCKCFVTLP
eukprot:g34604.t1